MQAAYARDGFLVIEGFKTPEGEVYAWDADSTYIQEPPFFDGLSREIKPITNVTGALFMGGQPLTDSEPGFELLASGLITQNELDADAAKTLVDNGVKIVAEGAISVVGPLARSAQDLALALKALFGAFGLFPLVYTVWLSFYEYRLAGGEPEFIGLENYVWLFGSESFYNSLWKTFTIGIIATVPQLCIAIGLAHLLNYNMRVRNFFRISMIMPYATSLVAATLVFASIFSNTSGGLANVVLNLLGMEPIAWTAGNWTAQIAIAVAPVVLMVVLVIRKIRS